MTALTDSDAVGGWSWAIPASVHDLASGEKLESAAFRELIAARASALTDAGLRRGGLALLSAASPITMLADVFATWSVGACAAVIDHGYSERERTEFSRFLAPDCAVDAAGVVEHLTSLPHEIPGHGMDAPALLLATSGTTAAPKFVILTHRALHARITGNVSAIGAEVLARTLVALPLSFGHGLIGNCLSACAAGGEVMFMDRSFGGIMGLGAAIDLHGVSFFSSVPSFWRMAARGPRPRGDSLRRVHIGSAPLGTDQAREISTWCAPASVWNCYGITETANWVSGQEVTDEFESNCIGQPFDAARLAVRADDGTIAQTGTGEILIRSASQMSGYFRAPDATATALTGGWFHTGDLGRISQTGVTILGRLKDEVNVAGFKVNPGEVDLVLIAHPDVAEACAYGRSDPVSGETIAAAVVLKPGAMAGQADLIEHTRANLRRIAVPTHIAIIDALPLTSRGKISRNAVRDHIEGTEK